MSKEPRFLVEMTQSQIEGIVSALDNVVKTNGLTVAEKCAEIYNALLKAEQKVEEPEPEEEVSLEEVEDELEQIMEVPKKRKRATRKKK